MRDASLAEFCWDYSSDMLRDPMNKASMFMSKMSLNFHNPLTLMELQELHRRRPLGRTCGPERIREARKSVSSAFRQQ